MLLKDPCEIAVPPFPRKRESSRLTSRTDPQYGKAGKDSWASNPAEDGRLDYFRNAEVSLYEKAGHWPHHDQLEQFVVELREFL